MHLLHLIVSALLSLSSVVDARHPGHLGKRALKISRQAERRQHIKRAASSNSPQFLTNSTAKFAVNGSAIPDVNFDIGESYAGLLPISSAANETSEFYFWFFPSTNPDAKKEITIWLNGGPGCSSLEGLLQENGPFVWQYGTYLPVQNPWTWVNLTNMLWVEQPLGTGFSVFQEDSPVATNEDQVAEQFLGFFKNFITAFSMEGYKVYVTGESYAGYYVPYIANAMYEKEDTTYYNVQGIMIYDPSIAFGPIQEQIVAASFVDYWQNLFALNDTFTEYMHQKAANCGYTKYLNEFLVFPPKCEQPGPYSLPGVNSTDGSTLDNCDVFDDIVSAAMLVNPAWDIYQVATTPPILWDVLGFPGSIPYLPEGASIYFNRTDVKKAINAPEDVNWAECANGVLDTDTSLPSGINVLPNVIEKSARTVIGHGGLDMVLIANGTMLAIQNMTWNGQRGFQKKPSDPFYVPYHDEVSLSTLAGSGIMGTTHTERNLTWVYTTLSGHMEPQYVPSASYRHLEYLLGRIDSLSSTEPFTTDSSYPQPDTSLGNGNAPPM